MDSDTSAPHHHIDNIACSQDSKVETRQPVEEDDQTPSLLLSEIPNADLKLDFSSIIVEQDEKIQKRMSNILKLNEENEKLQQELKAMSERLEAAERRRAQMQSKERPE